MESWNEYSANKEMFTYDGTFKKILPTAASSKIVGRKISTSQALKVSQQQKIKPKIIDITKMTKTKLHEGIRSESISPSPLKSKTKKLKVNKIPKTNLSSPLNMLSINKDKAKKKEIEIKTDKHKTIKNKKFIFEPTLQSSNLKVESLVKSIEEKNPNDNKRSKSKKAHRKSIVGNKDKDIIQVKIPSEVRLKEKCATSSHTETVERLKTEPDPMQRSLRSRLSQELFKPSKIPDKKPIKDPKPLKTKKSGTIQAYIKEKKRKQFIEKINKKIEEDFRERERISTLEQLEKRPKVLKPKKAPKKKLLENDYDKSKYSTAKHMKKHKKNCDSKPKTIDLKNSTYQSHDKLMQFLNPKSTKHSIFSHSSSQDFSSSSESCVSDLCTDRGEWINLLESKYSGTNSQFVEDFKVKMMKSQEEFEYKTRANGILEDEEEEEDEDEDDEKIKTVIEIEDSSSESYDFRDQKLESKELRSSHKVPPLTLSLLKNEDFDSDIDDEQEESYTDRDDFIKETKMMEDSGLIENESDEEYDEVDNEDYLDSDSDVGTPWVIDKDKGKYEKNIVFEEKAGKVSEEGGNCVKNIQKDDMNKLKFYGEDCGIEYDDEFSYKLPLNEQKVDKIASVESNKQEKIVVKNSKDLSIGMMSKGKTNENEDFKKNDQTKQITKSNARTKSLDISEENDFNAKMLDFLIKLHDPTDKIPEVKSRNKDIKTQTQYKDKDLIEEAKISPQGPIFIESKVLSPPEKQFFNTKDPEKELNLKNDTEKAKEIKPYFVSSEKSQGSKNLLAKGDNSKSDPYNYLDKTEEIKKDIGFNIEKFHETKPVPIIINEKGQDFKDKVSSFGKNAESKVEQAINQGKEFLIKTDQLASSEKTQEFKKSELKSTDKTQEPKEFPTLDFEGGKKQDPKVMMGPNYKQVTVLNPEKPQEIKQVLIQNREKSQESKQFLIPSPEKTKEPKHVFIPSPEKIQDPSGLSSSPRKTKDPKKLASSPEKTRQPSPPQSQTQTSKPSTFPTAPIENLTQNIEKSQDLQKTPSNLIEKPQNLQKTPSNLIEKPLETQKPSSSQTMTIEKTQDPKLDRISPSKTALADLKKTPTSYTKKLQALKLCSNLYSEDLSESSSDSKPSAKFDSDKKVQESPKSHIQNPNDSLKKLNPSPQTEELKSKTSKETIGKTEPIPENIEVHKQSPRDTNKIKGIIETYPKASPRPSPRPSPRMSPRMSPRIAPVNIEKACLRFDSSEIVSPSTKTVPVVAKIIENAKIYEKIEPKKLTESKNLLKLPEIIEKKSTEQSKSIEKEKEKKEKEKSMYSLFPENIDKFLDCPENIEKILESTPSYTKTNTDSLEKPPNPKAKAHKILTNMPMSPTSDNFSSNSVDPSPLSSDAINKTAELLTEAADILSKCTKNPEKTLKPYDPPYKTTDDSPDIISEKDEPFNFIALIEQSQAKYEKPKIKTHQNTGENYKNNTFMGFDIDDVFPDIINQELSYFLKIIPFKNIEKEVDSSIEFVLAYLDSMSKELKDNEAEVLEAINTPVFLEPVSKLALLQDISIDVLTKFPTLELILPVELCSELKMMFQSLDVPSRQIYLQMLFDCVNEALNYIRPFGINGIPDPWCNSARILFGESELENVFNRIIAYLIKWSSCRAGCFHSFESQNDEERLQALREEKMSSLLCLDVRDEEPNWLIYDEEETQVKIITANQILEDLLKETLDFL